MPAFRDSVWSDPENFANSDCDCTQTGPLCSSQQPGFQGVIAETVRQRSGSLRSCHPTHSWVALGPAAHDLLVGHKDCPAFCGSPNPFEALVEKNGCILTLGVGVDSITLWHYFEEILLVPYMGHFWPRERHLNRCVGAKRIQYEFPGVMQDVCIAAGILREGKIGKGRSGLMRARLREFHGDHICRRSLVPCSASVDTRLRGSGTGCYGKGSRHVARLVARTSTRGTQF